MLPHPFHDIYQKIAELAGSGQGWALAVVLASRRSTPCKAGAKAVFLADGTILGTIGGGAVEAEAGRLALETIGAGRPVVFDFVLGGEGIADVEPICGGAMRVLVVPSAALPTEAHAAAATGLRERARGVLVTKISMAVPLAGDATSQEETERRGKVAPKGLKHTSPGQRPGLPAISRSEAAQQSASCPQIAPPVRSDGNIAASTLLSPVSIQYATEDNLAKINHVDVEILRAVMDKEESQLVEAAPGELILTEPVIPPPLLVIVGAGHVGQALAWQAGTLGFEVLMIDDRQEFLGADLLPPGTVVRCGPMPQLVDSLSLTADTYVVIVTRGHQHDAEVLAACLNKPAAYIGMIGSRRKVAHMRRDFLDSGRATAEAFDRVYAPIGLDIGAKTVPEIAASIVAQLVAVRRCGTAPRIGVS